MAEARDHQCGACRSRWTPDEWHSLPYVGLQRFEGERLELRRCPRCQSTLSARLAGAQDTDAGSRG